MSDNNQKNSSGISLQTAETVSGNTPAKAAPMEDPAPQTSTGLAAIGEQPSETQTNVPQTSREGENQNQIKPEQPEQTQQTQMADAASVQAQPAPENTPENVTQIALKKPDTATKETKQEDLSKQISDVLDQINKMRINYNSQKEMSKSEIENIDKQIGFIIQNLKNLPNKDKINNFIKTIETNEEKLKNNSKNIDTTSNENGGYYLFIDKSFINIAQNLTEINQAISLEKTQQQPVSPAPAGPVTQQQQSAQSQPTAQSKLFKVLTAGKTDNNSDIFSIGLSIIPTLTAGKTNNNLNITNLLGNEKEVDETEKDIKKLNNKSYNSQLSDILKKLWVLEKSLKNSPFGGPDSIIKKNINHLAAVTKIQYAQNSYEYSEEQKRLKLEIERQKEEEERRKAEVTFDNKRENAYIEELVNRLKNNQWGKAKLNIKGEKINLNKEVSKLPEKSQRYLLTKALKRIYNGNNENGTNLQQQLGLDSSFSSEEKNEIINPLIKETIKQYFEKYKEELFAEKQPSKRKMHVDLTVINRNIKEVFDNEIKQAQQQTKKQAKFDDKVQERAEWFQDTFNDKSQKGKKNCRIAYKRNLKNTTEHELDVVALNKLANGTEEQEKIYKKIVGRFFIRFGTCKHIKDDQENYNNRSKVLNKALKDNKPKKVEKNLRKKLSKVMQEHPHDSEFTIPCIKLACNQDEKWQKRTLNAILPATKNVVIENADSLKDAFKNMSKKDDNGYSMIKPMKDDMAYFKILYARSNEETRNNFLQSGEFQTIFNDLSAKGQKRFTHFLEDIGEKKKIDELGLKPQQNEEVFEGQTFSVKAMADAMENNGDKIDINMTNDSNSKENSKEEELTPYYVFNQEGVSIKNDENLLAKETFKLQDSFLGLACAKDKKAGINSNWMRAKKTKDKDGNKIEDKDEQITSDQVKAQRAAEKAAREAIKQAGGDLNAIKKKTMPLLKNTKITFTFHGKPIPLSQAVEVCIELERRRREREQNLGIIKGEKIPEKTTVERISEMLKLNVEKGYFSDEEIKSVKEAISAQIIATQAFGEEFKNQTKTKGLENGKEQAVKKKKINKTTKENKQLDGEITSFAGGQSQDSKQYPRGTANFKNKNLQSAVRDTSAVNGFKIGLDPDTQKKRITVAEQTTQQTQQNPVPIPDDSNTCRAMF